MNHPASRRPGPLRVGPKARGIPALLLLAVMVAPPLPVLGAFVEDPDLGDATVGVLLYLDDEHYGWADVPVKADITALCATLAACAAQNVPLNYSMSQYGAYVTSLFGVDSPPDFSWWWEVLLWNGTAPAWQEAPVGASDLKLLPWDNIAWCQNRSAPPMPDPLTRYPSPKFRGDLANTGKALLPLPRLSSSSGYTGLGNGPIDSTPAVAHGRIYISTGGVYNWSTMTYEAQPQLWSIPAPSEREVSGPFIHRPTSAAGWQVSSPAIGAGMVVIGTSDGKVMAFTMDDLKPLWNFSIGPSATGVTASPVIFQGVIYVAGGDGLLYGLSTEGRMLWNLSLGGPAYMSTPAVSDGRLFVGSDAGVLTCAALNGTFLWNFTSGGKIRSSPAVSGGRVLFANTVYDGFTATASALFSIVAENGTQEWNRTVPASTSSPAIAGGRLFLGTNTGVSSYDLKGNLLWSHPTPGPIQSSPLVAGDLVVVTENSANGTVRYLSAVDGRELQSYTPRPEQYLFSSPVFTGDLLLVASDNGQIYHADFKSYAAPRVVSWQIPRNLEPGKPVQVRVTLANQGNLTSRDIQLQLRGSRGRVFDTQLNISHLAPGHNVTAVFNWTPQEGDTGLTLSVRDSQGDRGGSSREIALVKPALVPPLWISSSIALATVAIVAAAILIRRRARKGGA